MYTSNSELGTATVPAFLSKLWTLVEDPDTNELICWDPSGKSFHILDQTRFAKEILPLYFKHNNIASFIRQLNMYGFHKVISLEAANVKMEKDEAEFAHPCFLQGQEHLLEYIKRKPSNPKSGGEGGGGGGGGQFSEEFSKVYADVAAMKGRQDSMTTKLEHLKIENEVLWKELVALRQRHMKQEQIVNKLIQFLVTLVGDRTLGGLKRKLPLMLENTSTNDSAPPLKIPRTSSSAGPPALASALMKTSSGDTMEPLAIMKDGAAQSLELTDLLEDVEDNPIEELFASNEPIAPEEEANLNPDDFLLSTALSMDSQLPILKSEGNETLSLVDSSTNSSSPITTVAKADSGLAGSSSSSGGGGDFGKNDMINHLEFLQAGLDNLRDRFASGQYSFDSSTLFDLPSNDFNFPSIPFSRLFSPEASLQSPPRMLFSPDAAYLSTPNVLLEDEEDELVTLQKSKQKNDANGSVVGNELVQYNPPLDDYGSLFEQFGAGEPHPLVDPLNLQDQDDLGSFFDTNSLLPISDDLDNQ